MSGPRGVWSGDRVGCKKLDGEGEDVCINPSCSVETGMYNSFTRSTEQLVPSSGQNRRAPAAGHCPVNLSEGVTLTWRNITVETVIDNRWCGTFRNKAVGKHSKTLVNNVSGIVHPGCLLAILGASGAGKSTLLNVLTQRNIEGLRVEGEVMVNGNRGQIGHISAYVQQDDIFIGSLTVHEHLWFQSLLKMDQHLSKSKRLVKMNSLLKQLNLEKCRNVPIGVPGKLKGISGGEKRRLNFASEIMTDPPLLFCDEPTSGLDSFMSQSVVQVLKDMTDRGRTVVCTIHQPSSEVFAMFDRILLMVEGRVGFHGTSEQALKFFQDCGYPCPANFNPADHYVLMLAVRPGRWRQSKNIIKKICDVYDHSGYSSAIEQQLDENYFLSRNLVQGQKDILMDTPRYRCNWLVQFSAVLWRSWLVSWREPDVLQTRLLQAVLLGVIFGLIYFQQDYNQASVTNINGVIYILLIQITFGFVFSVIKTFPAEFPIFLKEHHDGMYRVDVYFISKILAELPQFIAIPCVTCTIVYWMAGLYPSAGAFLTAMVVIFLVCNVSVSFGYLLSCSSSNIYMLLSAAPIFIVPLSLVGGLYIDAGSIPTTFMWLRYMSWFTYANEILLVNHWSRVPNISCSLKISINVGNFQPQLNYSKYNATNFLPQINFSNSNYMFGYTRRQQISGKCFKSGLDVINTFGYNHSKERMVFNFCMLILLIVVFTLVAFGALYFRSRNKVTIVNTNKNRVISLPTSTC